MMDGVGFSVDQFKGMFFDSPAVEKAVEASERAALSKDGAFIMRDARQSIRSSKKSAPAGSPPRSHAGFFKKSIFFGWDQGSRSVVVGATLFSSRGGDPVPALLEEGGEATIRRRGRPPVAAHFAPHPYMGPALTKNEPKLSSGFADSVKG